MEATRSHERLAAGELEVRPDEGLALAAGHALTLSVRELGLLVALMRRAGGIVRRDELYRQVWGRELRAGDRSIDVYVHKLRTKLESAVPHVRFIHTHVGFVYRFDREARSHDFHNVGASRTQDPDQEMHP